MSTEAAKHGSNTTELGRKAHMGTEASVISLTRGLVTHCSPRSPHRWFVLLFLFDRAFVMSTLSQINYNGQFRLCTNVRLFNLSTLQCLQSSLCTEPPQDSSPWHLYIYSCFHHTFFLHQLERNFYKFTSIHITPA